MIDADPDGDPTPSAGLGGLSLAALTLGLITFPLAFNFGAYDVVFYQDVLKVIVASLILLLITFVSPAHRSRSTWLTRAALASFPAWFLVSALVVGSTGEAMDRPGFKLWLVVSVFISVPLTLKLLVEMFTPEVRQLRNRRLAFLVGVVVFVGVAGFIVGSEHPRFLTCADFAVAGSSEPSGCTK